MTTVAALFYEKWLGQLPVRINPFLSIALQIVLAYIPHFMRRPLLQKKLAEAKVEFNLAHSRHATMLAVDDSPLGRKLAAYVGCHQNGLEATIYFSAAILCAICARLDREWVERAAALFILARVLFTTCYLTSLNGPLRSLFWFIGVNTCIGILFCCWEKYLVDASI